MIDVQTVRCPDCGHSFDFSSYVGEEPLDSNVRLTKKLVQRASWEELEAEICAGRAALCLDVGDKLEFELKNGKKVSVEVAAVNPYGDNVAFSFSNILWENFMNWYDTNDSGWSGSDMADYLDTEVFPLLPDELHTVIKTREIVQEHRGTTCKGESRLWLPSYTEVFGRNERYSACDVGDVQFPLFAIRKNRIKVDKNDDVRYWWLRSPFVGTSTNFCYVYANGSGSSYYASSAYGVCPCFIIGKKPEVKVEE